MKVGMGIMGEGVHLNEGGGEGKDVKFSFKRVEVGKYTPFPHKGQL
jgi:hypothetical protein